MNGTFNESSYDETKLSRLESKWKEFLGTSVLSNQNLEAERHRLEQFISDISHQTKTPMTNIKMYTELLCEEINSLEEIEARENTDDQAKDENAKIASINKIKKYSREIAKQNERLEFLIDSLTKLSRLESGTLEVVPNRSDINELIKSGVSALKPKADKKKIVIITNGDGTGENDVSVNDPLFACFDMKWTLEALINVLDNAVKYSPEGGKIEVTVSETEMYAAVHVIDEGPGISEKEATEIFGRFFRGSDVQQEDGVGIGLYLTREILSKEDGYIKVVPNEKRKGAEFILYLRKQE